MNLNSKRIALWSIGVGALFTLGTFALFLMKTGPLDLNVPIADGVFSNYGQLIGGVVGTLFSLAGIFLLIQNLNDQERNFHTEQLESRKQQLEGRFFELIRIHRQNSDSINIGDRTGKKVFIPLLREFYECHGVVRSLEPEYKLAQRIQINLAYLAFYYGAVGTASEDVLRIRLENIYEKKIINDLIKAFKKKQRSLLDNDEFTYKPFEGHQSRLGHYFRHLFQSVSYINKQPPTLLSYNEKYEYVKVLRAQLSTQEQVLLFLNSLSDLGGPWELAHDVSAVNLRLITKYNLIKNIPEGFVQSMNVRAFYANVCYEGDTKKGNLARIKLEQDYC